MKHEENVEASFAKVKSDVNALRTSLVFFGLAIIVTAIYTIL